MKPPVTHETWLLYNALKTASETQQQAFVLLRDALTPEQKDALIYQYTLYQIRNGYAGGPVASIYFPARIADIEPFIAWLLTNIPPSEPRSTFATALDDERRAFQNFAPHVLLSSTPVWVCGKQVSSVVTTNQSFLLPAPSEGEIGDADLGQISGVWSYARDYQNGEPPSWCGYYTYISAGCMYKFHDAYFAGKWPQDSGDQPLYNISHRIGTVEETSQIINVIMTFDPGLEGWGENQWGPAAGYYADVPHWPLAQREISQRNYSGRTAIGKLPPDIYGFEIWYYHASWTDVHRFRLDNGSGVTLPCSQVWARGSQCPQPPPGKPPNPVIRIIPIILPIIEDREQRERLFKAARMSLDLRPYDILVHRQKLTCDGAQITCGDPEAISGGGGTSGGGGASGEW